MPQLNFVLGRPINASGSKLDLGQFDRVYDDTIISTSLLNGGFETPGTGGADVFGSWGEITGGTSTINDETTIVHSGSHACRMDVDAAGSSARIDQLNRLIVGRTYRATFWAKASATASISSDCTGIVTTLTTSYAQYAWTFVAAFTSFDIKRANATSKSIYIDDVTLECLNVRHGCVGEWDMVDPSSTRILDGSGNGNTAIITGATSVVGVNGLVKQFDGVDDVINCGSAAILDDIPQLSVDMWFKRNSFGGGNAGKHVNKGGWSLECPGSAGMFFQCVFSTTDGKWLSPSNGILTGLWYHVVVAYDSTSAANLPAFYVNGLPVITTVFTAPVGAAVSDASTALFLGNYSVGNRGFDGLIGLVRLYNRILAQSEAQTLYRDGAARFGLPG